MYNFIINLSRPNKLIVILLVDSFLALVALKISVFLRFENDTPNWVANGIEILNFLIPLAVILSLYISSAFKIVLRIFSILDVYKILIYVAVVSLLIVFVNFLFFLDLPRSIPVIFFISFFSLIIITRIFVYAYLSSNGFKNSFFVTRKIIIYGAGYSGQQLCQLMSFQPNVKIVGFIDDNPNLNNVKVLEKKVFNKQSFLTNKKRIAANEMWIAIPSLNAKERDEISKFGIDNFNKVLSLPSLEEAILSENLEQSLDEVNPNSFLGRSSIDIDKKLFINSYKDKTVLVTGAGGSIGSELCRQLLSLQIKKIILFDISEFALYSIEQDLLSLNKNISHKIASVIGSVLDPSALNDVFSNNSVDIVIHAAAYKHVPLVEKNLLVGVKNNIFGTKKLAEIASKYEIDRFILVSTDKAVQPQSYMGFTKKVSEHLVKLFSQRFSKINYSIVRFGNVLGSSGSVIPLFKKQIKSGGPITITDPEMTRYFMSIEEASSLILLAGTMGTSGEIFLLDMGKPIKIIDLAKSLIKSSNLSEKSITNPKGDIEILITKIRPGEKIHETLSETGSTKKTSHKKVFLDIDETFNRENLEEFLNEAISDIEKYSEKDLINTINKYKKTFIKVSKSES
tara:strand:+ start:78 stop:1952 length:1875 start_codon:yes stop_codon:yes gene_type:complete